MEPPTYGWHHNLSPTLEGHVSRTFSFRMRMSGCLLVSSVLLTRANWWLTFSSIDLVCAEGMSATASQSCPTYLVEEACLCKLTMLLRIKL